MGAHIPSLRQGKRLTLAEAHSPVKPPRRIPSGPGKFPHPAGAEVLTYGQKAPTHVIALITRGLVARQQDWVCSKSSTNDKIRGDCHSPKTCLFCTPMRRRARHLRQIHVHSVNVLAAQIAKHQRGAIRSQPDPRPPRPNCSAWDFKLGDALNPMISDAYLIEREGVGS